MDILYKFINPIKLFYDAVEDFCKVKDTLSSKPSKDSLKRQIYEELQELQRTNNSEEFNKELLDVVWTAYQYMLYTPEFEWGLKLDDLYISNMNKFVRHDDLTPEALLNPPVERITVCTPDYKAFFNSHGKLLKPMSWYFKRAYGGLEGTCLADGEDGYVLLTDGSVNLPTIKPPAILLIKKINDEVVWKATFQDWHETFKAIETLDLFFPAISSVYGQWKREQLRVRKA